MAGSRCVTYKSIKRVPRRIAGCTMPTIARPNASSSGVNVVTPLAFWVLLALRRLRRSVVLELLLATTLWPRRASTVLRQTFGAHNPRKKCWVSEILFDRSQRLPAGQKHRARPRRVIVRWDETRLLKFHFQNRVGLVKLRRPREVTQRKKKASQNANRYDPNTFQERMPIPAKIERLCSPSAYSAVKGAPGLSEWGATVAPLRDWAGSITAKYWLEPYTKKCVRKGEGEKISAKKYFRRR